MGVTQQDFEQSGMVVQIGLPPRRIDLLTGITGVEFAAAWPHRTIHSVGTLKIPFLSREDLIQNKRSTGRARDAADVEGLRGALIADRDPRTGQPTFTLATALSLLVFFVFALQCVSTMVVMARETGSWRWPAFAFSYMLALAYGASFVTFRLATAFL